MTKRAPSRGKSTTASRSRKSSTATRARARSTPSATVRRKPRRPLPRLQINVTHVEMVLGVALAIVALVTLLSLPPDNRGQVTEWWMAQLTRAFGWGRYAVPLVLGAGAACLLTRFGTKPAPLPWKRLGGGLLLLVTLMGLSHHLLLNPEAALAAGEGGGTLGYRISEALAFSLGWGGAVVVFVLFLAIGLTLVLNLSLEELVADAGTLRKWIADRLESISGRSATGGTAASRPARPQSARPQAARPQSAAATASAPRPASKMTLEQIQALVTERPKAPAPAPKQPAARPTSGTVSAPAEESPIAGLVDYDQERRWTLPPVEELLALDEEPAMSLRDIRDKTRIIEETLMSLGVPVSVVEVNPGPVVTQFGLEPGYVERQDRKGKIKRMKVQVSRIAALSNDIALALAASPIRIEAPVPGKGIVGIEVPNKEMSMVGLRSVMESDEFRRDGHRPLMVAFGRDVSGGAVVDDLVSLPHLLIAGSTGSGKSVCINALIACLICRNTPDSLRLLMVDPKRVELSNYNGIPHLITPVVVEPGRVVGVLKWLASEMDRRYQLFSDVGARNLESYNKKMVARGSPHLPNIVMFIDELADLMMVAPDDVERQVCRIAQLSRATGIHLVIATQRPSVDVVTGLIKANFPARLSFLVSSQVDSRVIIDTPGADKLLGSGDALYMAPDSPKLARIQGCFVSDGELDKIIKFWKSQGIPTDSQTQVLSADPSKTVQKPLWPQMPGIHEQPSMDDDGNDDPLLPDATDLVKRHQKASVSFLQRGLRIGYSRAARMIDTLEEQGIIGPPTGTSKARDVLVPVVGDIDEPFDTDEEEEIY